MPEKWILRQYQSLPLMAKVHMSQARIAEWYRHWNGDVCISFSGGKDSTVLTHLVHEFFPDVPLIFANTGLEYPEIQEFARKMGAEFVRPKMSFSEVISTYGYPIISKENAEAIYYARRIRNSVGGVQRTGRFHPSDNLAAEQHLRNQQWTQVRLEEDSGWMDKPQSKQNKLLGEGCYDRPQTQRNQRLQNLVGGGGTLSRTEYRRNLLEGGRGNREDIENRAGGVQEKTDDGRTDWHEWRRRTIAGVGDFSEEKSSIFNKKKWLPLCRDTRFKISHMCCSVMKKGPIKIYQRKHKLYPYIGTLTEESKLREQAWIRHGCNAFEGSNKTSQPISFWTEQDILKYLYTEGYEIAKVYGDIVGVDKDGYEYEPLPGADCKLKCTGCSRTGCIFCGFGVHLEKGETRFQRLAKTHPRQYEYCMGGGQWVDNPDYDPVAPKMDGEWENWNPKQIWVPSKEGLGMKHVFDECNAIYGKDFVRYD